MDESNFEEGTKSKFGWIPCTQQNKLICPTFEVIRLRNGGGVLPMYGIVRMCVPNSPFGRYTISPLFPEKV